MNKGWFLFLPKIVMGILTLVAVIYGFFIGVIPLVKLLMILLVYVGAVLFMFLLDKFMPKTIEEQLFEGLKQESERRNG